MFEWDWVGAEKTSEKLFASQKGFSAPMGRAAVSEEHINMRRRPGCCSVSCLYWLGNAFCTSVPSSAGGSWFLTRLLAFLMQPHLTQWFGHFPNCKSFCSPEHLTGDNAVLLQINLLSDYKYFKIEEVSTSTAALIVWREKHRFLHSFQCVTVTKIKFLKYFFHLHHLVRLSQSRTWQNLRPFYRRWTDFFYLSATLYQDSLIKLKRH